MKVRAERLFLFYLHKYMSLEDIFSLTNLSLDLLIEIEDRLIIKEKLKEIKLGDKAVEEILSCFKGDYYKSMYSLFKLNINILVRAIRKDLSLLKYLAPSLFSQKEEGINYPNCNLTVEEHAAIYSCSQLEAEKEIGSNFRYSLNLGWFKFDKFMKEDIEIDIPLFISDFVSKSIPFGNYLIKTDSEKAVGRLIAKENNYMILNSEKPKIFFNRDIIYFKKIR